MRRHFRTGTWRQATITCCAVLPVSLVLNVTLEAVTAPWPRLVVVVLNALILVASLNWVLLPALHWLTRDWAARPRRGEEQESKEDRGSDAAAPLSP